MYTRRNQTQAAKAVGAEQGLGVTSTANGPILPTALTCGSGLSLTNTPATRNCQVRTSPERIKRNSSGFLIPVPEEGGDMEFNEERPLQRRSHSVVIDTDEDDGEEVEEWLLEQELAKEGLYQGSYKCLVALYTITPITTILAFGLLAAFPLVVYPPKSVPHSPYPYAPYLPYPLPELLTAAALWSMSLLLRDFIFSLSSSISTSLPPHASVILALLATVIQTLISVFLQLVAVALLLIGSNTGIKHPTWHDHAFQRIWTVALGWAGAEAIVGIKQGYENIGLYRDVLVSATKIELDEIEGDYRLGERQPLLPPGSLSKNTIEQEVQDDLDQLVALKSREELEEIYGIPVIKIPVFISCLHRINAVLNSLGTFLLLSAAYLRSPLAPSSPRHIPTLLYTLARHSHKLLGVTVVAVVICQIALALMHTAWVLPRIGVPTYVYIGLLFSLSLFFAGLAFWEALV